MIGCERLKFKFLTLVIFQLFILGLLNELGYLIVGWLNLPIPGNVLGMILLFILLLTGVLKLEWINEVASFLLKHLVFFFIPITVGIMTLGTTFLNHGIFIIIILIASAAIGMIVTGNISQFLSKKKEMS